MEILSTGNYLSGWSAATAVLLIIAFVLILLGFCEMENILCISGSVFLAFSIFTGIRAYEDFQRPTYKIILKDVTYEKLCEDYKILNQEGQIIEVVKKVK